MSVEHYEPFSLVASFFRLSNKPGGTIFNLVGTISNKILRSKFAPEIKDLIFWVPYTCVPLYITRGFQAHISLLSTYKTFLSPW